MVHLTSKFEKQKVNPMATIYQAKELACQWSKAFNEETHAHDTNNLVGKKAHPNFTMHFNHHQVYMPRQKGEIKRDMVRRSISKIREMLV